MKSLLSPALASFIPSREPRQGVVWRIGPWFGPGDVEGLVFMLRDDPTPYVVLRDNQECRYPAGLTQPGDEVAFDVNADGIVSLSRFRNLSLDAALGGGRQA